ncbi:uncharacterized protein E6C27_scaffold466G00560 [Cucumis melo var. makuwa]|uniref:Uncharacterized protein n=2 Tax=Cucumis melo TaxID=3656 RepID=A0A5A7U0T1_CUCMM|nr:uncharacterized protein E6C27_scaffold466G00560 [Cucumis melo var. makuwa]
MEKKGFHGGQGIEEEDIDVGVVACCSCASKRLGDGSAKFNCLETVLFAANVGWTAGVGVAGRRNDDEEKQHKTFNTNKGRIFQTSPSFDSTYKEIDEVKPMLEADIIKLQPKDPILRKLAKEVRCGRQSDYAN